VIATADLIASTPADQLPAALVATWAATGMKLGLDARAVATALADVG